MISHWDALDPLAMVIAAAIVAPPLLPSKIEFSDSHKAVSYGQGPLTISRYWKFF